MHYLLLFILFFHNFRALTTTELAKCSAGGVDVEQVSWPVEHGEGPHWDPRRQLLYFVDISNQTVNRLNPADGTVTSTYIRGGPVSPVVPTGKSDWFFVGRGLDLVLVQWNGVSPEPSSVKVVAAVDPDKPLNRFNDGKADASGRLWIGTMGPENPDLKLYQGSLYSFSIQKKFLPKKQLTGVSVSNGLGWNHNDTLMYYIDSPTRTIHAFEFDLLRGSIKDRRTVFSFDQFQISGVPDGMAVDSEGMLWVAVYSGGSVLRVDPNSGGLLRTIRLPVSRVTSCAFGGPGLSVLYVTTSRRGLTPAQLLEEPLAGSVFAVRGLDAKGQRKSNTATRPMWLHPQLF